MTHDELFVTVDRTIAKTNAVVGLQFCRPSLFALRAVVELTRKYEEFDGVDSAGMSGYRLAMKQVIQAIEKELK